MATEISRGVSRGQIWTSIDGSSWQVMLIEPYRCDISRKELPEGDFEYYITSVTNIITGHVSANTARTIDQAKLWCKNESIRLSKKRRTKS